MCGSPHSGPTPHSLETLARISQRCGANPLLTQGAGGNTSVKSSGRLVIKASGKRLARALDENIFVEIGQEMLANAIQKRQEIDFNKNLTGSLRGSIETPLHAVIPQAAVIHVHSVNAICYAIRRDGRDLLEKKLKGLPWAWVPYAKPGWPLTWELQKTLPKKPSIWILQNHGLIVAHDSLEGAEEKLYEIEKRLDVVPSKQRGHLTEELASYAAQSKIWRITTSEPGASLAFDNLVLGHLSTGVVCPDQAVFLGPKIAVVNQVSEIPSTPSTSAIVVRGHGTLVQKSLGQGADDMLTCLGLLAERLPPSIDLNYLSDAQVAELLNWDAEKHRQAIDITR